MTNAHTTMTNYQITLPLFTEVKDGDKSQPLNAELTKEVLKDLLGHRHLQHKLHGEQNHHPAIWMLLAHEEFGEISEAIQNEIANWGKSTDATDIYEEIMHTAGVLVAFAEHLRRINPELRMPEYKASK